MNIQWFPGHMSRAQRLLSLHLDKVDVIVEVVDARIPQSSRSPFLSEINNVKPVLVLLNKVDLADFSVVKMWMTYFKRNGDDVLAVSSKNSIGFSNLRNKIGCMKSKYGVSKQVQRFIVVGVPNTGKSTLINALSRKKCAQTADIPGITRELMVYKLGRGLELIDSPGTLSPKIVDQTVAARLAALGSVKSGIYSAYSVLETIYPYLKEYYSPVLCERYNIQRLSTVCQFIEQVALRFHKNSSESENLATQVLHDLRDGRCGSLCLERP